MSALKKLGKLQIELELLERNSSNSIGIDEIKSLRKSVNELSKDLHEELRYSHQYHESYRTKSKSINSEEKIINDHDDETLAWLDENYGGNDGMTLISPKRSPLERFKLMGNLLKTEIKECRKYGLDTKNIKGLGWARMSISPSNSSLTLSLMSLAIPSVNKMLANCWNLNEFDIFEFAAMPEIRGHILLIFGSYLAKQFSWLGSYHIPSDRFHNFLMSIEQSYNDVPYHNKIHAADVAHTMSHFCKSSIFTKHLSELDKLSAFIAAIIHDVGHTGQTNNYHINSSSVLAIRYNDRSVLENFHLSLAFSILRDPKNNFLENLTKTEYRYCRDTIIELVLGTDLFYHQKQLKKLQQFANIMKRQKLIDFQVYNNKNNKIPRIRSILNEKRFIMEVALHLSDISNPTKKLSVSIEWTKRITQEFFDQGDMEKSLRIPISPGCDRNINQNMAKQSIAFIDFIVYPMYNAYHCIDEESIKFINGIKTTRAHWQSQM